MLTRFNVMWAFAVHDLQTQEKKVLAPGSRFGIKRPLHRALTPQRFVFASEMQAILKSGNWSRHNWTVRWRVAWCSEPFGVEVELRARYSNRWRGCRPGTTGGCAPGAWRSGAGGAP